MKHTESAPQVQVGVELAEVERELYACNCEMEMRHIYMQRLGRELADLAEIYTKLKWRREELLRGKQGN